MNCTHRCNQGRQCTCAIVTFYAETEGVMQMRTGCSTKAPPNPAQQPLPVIDAPKTGKLLVIGAAAVVITTLAYLAARVIVLFAPG